MAKILMIEDDNRTGLVLHLLKSAGHAVTTATSAEAGLALARAEAFDLILMDINLPGMSGLEATVLLKADEQTRAIPVVAITTLTLAEDVRRIGAAGCDGYLAKPGSFKEFLAGIARHLARGR